MSTALPAGAPLPPFPPEWVLITDVPAWVARLYNVDPIAVALELIPAVRGRVELQHRIPGINANHSSMYQKSWPDGLDKEGALRSYVSAINWEAAETDWTSGTVGGWGKPGERERLPIEVAWQSVERFAVNRLAMWRRTIRRARESLETRRAERIEKFRKRQRTTRAWIEVKKVASDISSPKGRDWISPTSAGAVYAELRASFERGEFDAAEKLKVLFLCPHQRQWGRLTRERLSDLPDDGDGNSAWLQWCWVPRDLMAGWLRRKGVEIPQYMLSGGQSDRGQIHGRVHDDVAKSAAVVMADAATPLVLPLGHRDRTGPQPILRIAIRDRMIQDYKGRPDALEREKQETLKSAYGAKSRDTVVNARTEALNELR